MNYSICFYTLGTLLKVEAGLMLLPLLHRRLTVMRWKHCKKGLMRLWKRSQRS